MVTPVAYEAPLGYGDDDHAIDGRPRAIRFRQELDH